MDSLLGEWKLTKSTGWEDYMKAVGVNVVLRKLSSMASVTERWARDGDTWTLDILTTVKNLHVVFKLNEEFDETTGDGRKVKSTFRVEGSDLIHVQKGSGESVVTRTVEGNSIKAVFHAVDKDVKCERIFTRT